ncbi:hypothetical protein L195_g056111, partial [Trifolium pratense]
SVGGGWLFVVSNMWDWIGQIWFYVVIQITIDNIEYLRVVLLEASTIKGLVRRYSVMTVVVVYRTNGLAGLVIHVFVVLIFVDLNGFGFTFNKT